MERKPPKIVRPADVDGAGRWFTQRLNPRSRFRGAWLSRLGGLSRVAVDHVTLPPGAESFALHAHHLEEEWLYILRGHPTLLTEEGDVALAPGDFVAMPAPQRAHNLANRTDEDVAYLVGGEPGLPFDVLDYPSLQKSYLLTRVPGQPTGFRALGPVENPFGPVDEEK
ncbi:MAG TPA: cupin domain-containing protein [Polyangia bacterium]|nr:cupin domain-containing protein [Polyangia bacterium]